MSETEPQPRLSAVDEAAERIFQSGVLGEIAAAAMDDHLDGRDEMDDALAIARLVLGGED